MDIEQPVIAEQLLTHAARQTKALESLRQIAVGWTIAAVVVFGLWLLWLLAVSAS